MSSSPVLTEKNNINFVWPMRSSVVSFLVACMEKTILKDHGISTVLSSPMSTEGANIKDFVSKRYSTVRP